MFTVSDLYVLPYHAPAGMPETEVVAQHGLWGPNKRRGTADGSSPKLERRPVRQKIFSYY
jgi:hypothetical protein